LCYNESEFKIYFYCFKINLKGKNKSKQRRHGGSKLGAKPGKSFPSLFSVHFVKKSLTLIYEIIKKIRIKKFFLNIQMGYSGSADRAVSFGVLYPILLGLGLLISKFNNTQIMSISVSPYFLDEKTNINFELSLILNIWLVVLIFFKVLRFLRKR
jgi:hypothetical protein